MNEFFLRDICGSDLLGAILDALKQNLFTEEGAYSAAFKAVASIHDTVIKPFAIMLMILFFMIAMVDKLSSENFTWEQVWRQLAMFVVAKFLIDHGFEILQYLFHIGILLMEDIVYEAPAAVDVDFATVTDAFKESLGLTGLLSVLGDLILFIILIIPWILSWVLRLCVYIICYTRIIEIYARATFAPIALSDFFHSGLQGTGWRFLKNFLAVCLQGAMILVIGVIFSKLFQGLIGTMDWASMLLLPALGKFIAYYAAAIMLMFKSLSLSKEIVGAS